nr:malonyl-CoA acyltransferase [Gentiana hybrid cultivar]
MIKIIEECRASPPPGTVAKLTLPITYFDVYWLNFHHVQRLLFYKLPLNKSTFIETIIPNLKNSISLALKHYLPLAGNLVSPLQHDDSGVPPVLCYLSGDSIPLIFAESLDEDFDRLAGNQASKCDDFYPLIPVLKPPVVSTNLKITPLSAVQVTLFPNSGISIGFTNHHVTGDANVIVGFIKAWASINKLDGDSQLVDGNLIPFYDRSGIKDPYDLTAKLLSHSWQESSSQVSVIPANKVRATFVLRQSKIQELKNYVLKKSPAALPSQTHVSSFTVTCAYIWTCLLKTKDAVGDTTSSEEAEFLIFPVNCRSRLDPPIPAAYLGNCLVPCCTTLTHEELVSKDGFLFASQKIGAAIHEIVNDKEGILNGSRVSKGDDVNWNRVIGVTGTTKNDIYEADFGWGKPKKFVSVSIDIDGAMSLNQSGREESGLEVGLSLPEKQMEAFASIFTSGLDETYSYGDTDSDCFTNYFS